jgi:aspartyl-tRNA(Asn)/glutamyl-tRNA(Gln) amidotransferase subunit A
MQEALSEWSLTELRARLKGGEVSAREAVRACMERIAAENGALRAFVTVASDAAIDAALYAALNADFDAGPHAAEAADLGKMEGRAGALWGIPVAIKDLIDVRGMPTTAASRVLEGAAAAEADAECVRRLRAAGAIVVGKTNLHEFAFGGSGVVSAYGAVRNPLDRSRVSGGSSSGSAAAVAAGMCFGALGTDTAGSIRLPAACCGVVGFKPTWSAIPVAGVIPLAWSYDHVGPLARTVEDAGELYAVLAGEAPGWTQTKAVRCGVARSYFCEGLEPEVEAGFERALEAARGRGWSLHEVEIEVSEDRRVSNAETWAFHQKWVEERGALYDPRTLARIVNGKTVRVEEYVEARRAMELTRERWRGGVAGVDVVLTPTSPLLPPKLEEMEGPEARAVELKMLRNTRPFNVLGWPAVTLPCAAMVGVQVSAGWGSDWLVLSAAREMERALR